jgi:signal peptidase I
MDDMNTIPDNKISEPNESGTENEFPPKRRFIDELFEWIEMFSGVLLVMILIFTFAVRHMVVEGASMERTLYEEDVLIVSNLFYEPAQNDIVVIQVPNTVFDKPIIKRVIATEGQTVDFDFDNWKVYVDGVELDEPYVNYDSGYAMYRDMFSDPAAAALLPLTVEPGKIFVMGDNRNHSSDSRDSRIGQVDVHNVVGRVLFRAFPFNKFGVVKPDENAAGE